MLNLASYLESICDVVWLRFIIFQVHITEIDNDNKCTRLQSTNAGNQTATKHMQK